MQNWIIAGLVVALALSITAAVVALQAQPTARVQLRIWESSEDPSRNFLSVRPEGERWRPGAPLLPLDDGLSPGGRYRYGDFAIETTVPEPRPFGVEISDVTCARGRLNPYLTIRGSVRNVTDATLTDISISAALRDRTGVEVSQGAAIIAHSISPWGTRPFAVNFYNAVGVKGTCHIVEITYEASVRYDVPSLGAGGQ